VATINQDEALAIIGDVPDRHEAWRRQVVFCYGDELAEGAADRIKAGQPTLWNQPPGRFDQALAEFLETPAGRRCLNPKYRPPDGETALEATLRRLPITPEALVVLSRTKQLDWGHLPDGLRARLASELVRHPSNGQMLAVAPPPSAAEGRVAGVLLGHFSDLPIAARASMAKAWAFEFGGIHDEHALVERIARRLSLPAAAAHYGVEPLAKDDRRLNAKVQAQLDARAELLGGVEGNRRHGPPGPEPSQARDERGQFTGETVLYSGPNPF
jgi:hypothetical protein